MNFNADTNEQIKKNNGLLDKVFRLLSLMVVTGGFLIAIKLMVSAPQKLAKDLEKTTEKVFDFLTTKTTFDSAFGPIVSQERFRRLQFFKRNQVCLFRIIRYRGDDMKNHDYVEFYKKESDKKKLAELPIFMGQYCEWQAKGTFEFNFYVDMGDLSKWNHKWDPIKFVLTLYPPDIGANTPAELEPLMFTRVAKSISVNTEFTKSQLQEAITKDLKMALAEDQKKFVYEEARLAIKTHYIDFFKLIPGAKIDRIPEIVVVFPHEREFREK
ncbi:MAG TPA: hypothetical protein PK821_06550 [Victivallales bacterium]|nr:hypothetical protein [Victivallales bacterium]